MEKRHEFVWLPGGDHDHNNCDCDLKVTFPALHIPDMIEKRYTTHYRTVREMYASVKANIVAKYYLKENEIASKPFDMQLYIDYLREYSTSESQIAISPPFSVDNRATEIPTVPNPEWRTLHRAVESYYWGKLGLYAVRRDVDFEYWSRKLQRPVMYTGIPTLQELCFDILSWVKTTYDPVVDGDKKLARVVNTSNYFPLEKQLKLYREFDVNTARRGRTEERMWEFTPGALKWLNYQMQNEQHFGSVTFFYDPRYLMRKIKIYTSAGINSGGTVIGVYKGMKIKVVSSGKKIFCMEAAIRQVHEILAQIRKDERDYANVITAVIKAKQE